MTVIETPRWSPRPRALLVFVVGIWSLAASATAQPPVTANSEEREAKAGRQALSCSDSGPTASPGHGAPAVVVVDRETGRFLVPASGRHASLDSFDAEDPLRQSEVGLVEEEGAAGAVVLDLRGRHRSFLVARVGADGTLEVSHASGPVTDGEGKSGHRPGSGDPP